MYVREKERKRAHHSPNHPPMHPHTHNIHKYTLTHTCAVSGAGGRGRVVAQNAAPPMVLSSRDSRAGTAQRETGIGVDRDIRVLQAKAAAAKKKLKEAEAKMQHTEAAVAYHSNSTHSDHVAYHSNSTPSMVFSSR